MYLYRIVSERNTKIHNIIERLHYRMIYTTFKPQIWNAKILKMYDLLYNRMFQVNNPFFGYFNG